MAKAETSGTKQRPASIRQKRRPTPSRSSSYSPSLWRGSILRTWQSTPQCERNVVHRSRPPAGLSSVDNLFRVCFGRLTCTLHNQQTGRTMT